MERGTTKAIINGCRYDIEKATLIGYYGSPHEGTDLHTWEAELYVTKQGRYFLAGTGGPMSRYGTPMVNGFDWGEKIEPMSKEDALRWAEQYLDPEIIEAHFGSMIEDA
jgi:hypothetical protein